MAMTKHSYAHAQQDVNELISSHSELVRKIAWQIHGRARHITEIEDLVQIGLQVLFWLHRNTPRRMVPILPLMPASG